MTMRYGGGYISSTYSPSPLSTVTSVEYLVVAGAGGYERLQVTPQRTGEGVRS